MKRISTILLLLALTLAACAPVDLNAPLPNYESGVDASAWAQVPAGEFYYGQHEELEHTDAYEIMVTNVTAAQYASFLNEALAAGFIRIDGDQIVGYLPRR